MGVRIWDRLLQAETTLPSGPQQLGRFIMLDGERSLSVGGRQLSPGDYLAATGAWTLWDVATNRGSSGRFDARALPEEMTVQCILAVGARLNRLTAATASVQRWLKESPLMQRAELESRIKRHALDDRIDDHLDALKDVCHRPADRIRVVNRLVPVGAARRIVPATITRLAAHSEDWNRLLPDGVEPNVVLTPIHMENFDFYENRVAARLVEHLWQDISLRLGHLKKIDALVDDIRRYTEEAARRPWRAHDKLFNLIHGISQNQPWRDLVAERQAELRAYREALYPLRSREVLPGVNRHAEIGTALRPTNLFANENRYRRVRDLWRAWVEDRTGARTQNQTTRAAELFGGFTGYAGLLILHALDHLGHLGDLTLPFARGAHPLPLSGTRVTLYWAPTDTFELAVDGEPVLRIVPLPHAITRTGRAAAVQNELTALIAPETGVRSLILYPGGQDERESLPTRLRLLAFAGSEAPPPGGRAWALLPVSPLELDSVMRVARSLRGTLEQHRHQGYPVRLDCGSSYATALAEGTTWLSVRRGGLDLTRPPTPAELAQARKRLDEMRTRAAGRVDLRGEIAPLDRLATELPAAATRLADFATCPVCRHSPADPWRMLRPRRRENTYECVCDLCDARWDLRVCKNCNDPFLTIRSKSTPKPATFDGDELDRLLGSQLVSAPCWLRPSVYICPKCGVCGHAVASQAAGCLRCSPSAPPG